MFFPIGDDNVRGGHAPLFTWSFLALNCAVFLFQVTRSPEVGAAFVERWGYHPADIEQGHHLDALVSSMFVHGGWMHVIGNMLFLWVFADNIEAVVGNGRFALFYLGGGLVAAAAHTVFNLHSDAPCIGASGAIAAVLGAYLVMFPSSRVKVVAILIFWFPRFLVPAFVFLGIWILQNLVSGVGSLNLDGVEPTEGVAWWAHIGGFVFGFFMGLIYRGRYNTRGILENQQV